MATSAPEIIDHSTRQRLLDAALELFSRKGYAATSVRELVEAAGVTKPVLYYYFRNKEDIYLALIQSGLEEFHQTAQRLKTVSGPLRERITGYCTGLLDIFMARLPVARLIYAIYYGPPQGAPPVDFDAAFSAMLLDVAAMLQEGISTGELAGISVEDASWSIVAILNTTMEEQLCHSDRPRLDRENLQRMLALIFKGIAHD